VAPLQNVEFESALESGVFRPARRRDAPVNTKSHTHSPTLSLTHQISLDRSRNGDMAPQKLLILYEC